ncbi:hypothetical protein RMSM_06190 [Rhodopirellula maiorica SM1]|uniref:Uncharacterized protein n=1 Tax=Rhodopirellula maiorica SM1 TaxID=1265738 RepID=M5RBY0_9BACT|nr:hypothetical protein RMSM_06190 [Rhodopirellula maiorica SM1]
MDPENAGRKGWVFKGRQTAFTAKHASKTLHRLYADRDAKYAALRNIVDCPSKNSTPAAGPVFAV